MFVPDIDTKDKSIELVPMQPLQRRFPSLAAVAQYADDSDTFTQIEELQDHQPTEQISSEQRNTDSLIQRSTRQRRLKSYLQDFVMN